MDIDLYWVVVIFFFIVLPIIQRVLGVGKHGQPPTTRRPPPRRLPDAHRLPETPRRQVPPPTAEPARRSETEMDPAAEMIPAELWEILTGQRRPPVVLPPSPEPDVDEELAEDEEAVFRPAPASEDRAIEDLMRRRDAELARDRAVDHTPPRVVTLETEPLPEPARHAAFHAQMERTRPLQAVAVAQRPTRHSLSTLLRSRSDLRRSIIIQEVLGPPKGLE